MLKTYLMENYGYNEPIFLNDLTIQGLSENAVRQAVKRLVANGLWVCHRRIICQSVRINNADASGD